LNRKDAQSTFETILLEETEKIIKKADEEGIVIRLMGAMAFRCHCPKFSNFHELMDRKLSDIDLASYTSESSQVDRLLRNLGYVTQSYVQVATAMLGRSIYWKQDNKQIKVDIFWDELKMNHTINFRGRLELDKPTIPLSEMLQEKLQIVKLNWKDIKDTVMLLMEHDVAEQNKGRETIDLMPIIKRASKDWGYYYTFTTNIKKIQEKLSEIEVLSNAERSVVQEKLSKTLDAIEREPKSIGWKMRAKIGTKKLWYNEVE